MEPALLGIIGSSISFLLWLPQARTIWRVRKDPHALSGVSLGTQLLVIANATVWFAYAFALQEFWVGAAGLVNLPLALFTVALLLRARLRTAEFKPCEACGGRTPVPAETLSS